MGTARNPEEALRWFRRAARVHVPMAMNMVGRCYEYGLGTTVDHTIAAFWYRRAAAFAWYRQSAEGGDFRGQCSYASVLVEQGKVEKALHWLRLASKSATPGYWAHLASVFSTSPCKSLRDFAATETRPYGSGLDIGPAS